MEFALDEGVTGFAGRLPCVEGPRELYESLSREFPGIVLQVIPSSLILNGTHAKLLVIQCYEYLKRGIPAAEKPEIDLLLRVAGMDRIDEALRRVLGARGRVCVILGFGRPDDVKKLSEHLRVRGLRGPRSLPREMRERLFRSAGLDPEITKGLPTSGAALIAERGLIALLPLVRKRGA